ncbi:MAG: T9SS type A sorting domain-containing protein, partial [Bacteroidetes bacterium]|nr:T9SS type A sorting domain-containing protein [Bacteroidota bacterium]
RVEFYLDGTLVGTDTSLPYTASVSDVGVGTYELTASAFDTDGLEGPSFPVTVSVTTGTTPPTVTLTQPFNGQVFIAPATILFAAEATPGDAPIDRVEFYSGETLIGTDTTPPYTATWTGVQPGTYVLLAKAIDENGAEGESTPVAVTVVEETGENIHFIPLLPGWNMISTYIEPYDPAMASVFAEIIDVVVMVRDGDGNVFIPESGIDDIGPWVMGEGYQVYVTDAATLEIEGIPIEPTTSPIQLGEGWNQIAYLRESPMPISEALATVSDQIVVVKDVFGRIYLPDLEIDQIGDMLPGQGYKVYVSEDCTLLYPPNGSGFNGGPLVAANGRSQSPALRKMKPAGTGILVGSAPPTSFLFGGYAVGNTATLVLQAPDELEGYLVGVRTDENEIVGEAVVWDGMAVLSILGDDTPNPSGSQGASPGDELDVFILGTDGREIDNYRIENLLDLLRGSEASTPLTYHEDDLWLASLEAGEEEVGETPGTFELAATNYPNPFTRTTTIAYSLNDTADVEIQVIDVLGRLVATLVAEMQEAGTYQTVFDGSRLASGTYFYRLRANYQVHTGRMTLAR